MNPEWKAAVEDLSGSLNDVFGTPVVTATTETTGVFDSARETPRLGRSHRMAVVRPAVRVLTQDLDTIPAVKDPITVGGDDYIITEIDDETLTLNTIFYLRRAPSA